MNHKKHRHHNKDVNFSIKLPFELSGKQKTVQKSFHKNNLVLDGCSGTGKTFISLYLSLQELKRKTYDKIIIVRSPVQTIDVGFLPGGIDLLSDGGKIEPFITPYKTIINDIMGGDTWTSLYGKSIFFEPGIAIRGLTFDNAIVIVDEMQNYNFHALDSIITRMGKNTKVIFCGDYYQSDFIKKHDKDGILKFLKIIDEVPFFHTISFSKNDIVRSDLVKQYIIAKEDFERK